MREMRKTVELRLRKSILQTPAQRGCAAAVGNVAQLVLLLGIPKLILKTSLSSQQSRIIQRQQWTCLWFFRRDD